MKPAFLSATLAAALGAVFTLSHPVVAQTAVCMPQGELDAALVDWYGEKALPGQDMEQTQVWVSDDTGTWTIVQYLADGNGCVVATGEDWDSATSEPEVLAALTD